MRKLTILFALLTLSAGLWAIDNVKYIDAAGVEQTANGVTEITNASTTLSGGWYVVYGADVQTGTLICQGAVHLILADGAKLTATGPTTYAGIQVSDEGNSLTIYAQSTGEQSGQLIANGGNYAAGIGGGNEMDGSNITINGGIVTATGGDWAAGIGGGCEGSGSYITINGGEVIATGGHNGAGIGGGDRGSGSNITINGGTVTATGGSYGAGIGGGDSGSGSDITINGGTVTATGSYGAGIGGGDSGSGSDITINGGTVTANGNDGEGAGIGGGREGSGSDITINGGTVTATGGANGAGIGGGDRGSGSNITINGGTVTATGGSYGAGIGGGGYFGDGSNITISGGTVTATGGEYAAGIGGGLNSYSASDIFVATSLVVKAGDSPNPTDEIAKTRTATTDIASDLAGKQYVTAKYDLAGCKDRAIAEINAAINGVTDENIIAIADKAKTDINAATTKEGVDAIKVQALADIALAKYKADAIAEIDDAVGDVTDENILAIATTAKTNISTATTKEGVDAIKAQALADIALAKYKADAVAEIQTAGQGIQNTEMNNWINGAIADIKAAGTNTKEKVDNIKNQILPMIQLFQDGKAEGIAEAAAALPTDPEGTAGHTVTITKGEKTLKLVNPDKVTYGKQD